MRKGLVPVFLSVGLLLAVAACEEAPAPEETPDGGGALFAPGGGPGVCDFRDVKRDARDYFSNPESRDAQDLIRLMEDACGAGDQATATSAGFQVLALMESVLYAGRGGPAAAGSSLANGLLGFMFAPRSFSVDFGGALAPDAAANGAFGVRPAGPADDTPVYSRGTPAWAAEPLTDWETSLPTGSQPALVYGAPKAASGFPVADYPLGTTYEWNLIPRPASGFDEQLVVGVCADDLPPEPDPTGTTPGIQRNATILEVAGSSACERDADAGGLASRREAGLGAVAAGALRLVRALLPEPLHAAALVASGGVGGKANNFSDFTPLAANTAAELVFVQSSGDASLGADGLGALGTVRVLARTFSGTPIEFIEVTLAAVDNNGANVVLGGDLTEVTVEDGGIATFEGLTLNKTGGYQLCATAVSSTFQFPAGPYCSERFNVRPN